MRKLGGVALDLAAAAGLAPAVAAARTRRVTRVQTPVQSASPDARIVKESYVRLYAPLPAADGPHPAACDWIGYLRFRSATGPRIAWKADAIFVTMPGIFAGASSVDQFARNVVRAALAIHRHVEVWTLDRRSNCLEDHGGVQYAARHHDPKLAFDYYFHGAVLPPPRRGRRRVEAEQRSHRAGELGDRPLDGEGAGGRAAEASRAPPRPSALTLSVRSARRGTGLVAHPVFKTGRAGQPPAWKVRFLRRVVAGNHGFVGDAREGVLPHDLLDPVGGVAAPSSRDLGPGHRASPGWRDRRAASSRIRSTPVGLMSAP